MELVIIKYNAGNVQSVANALERLNCRVKISSDASEISSADKVIFPGVGEASSTMNYLRQTQLDQVIRGLKQPVLGICLGMQLLCKYSEENQTECLGIFDEVVKRFVPSREYNVPQIGWNELSNPTDWLPSELEKKFVYYVNSYYVPVGKFTSAQSQYANPFSAAIRKDNFYAVQFHPEKSGDAGEVVLKSFLEL